MSRTINIDPITRISGFLEIETKLNDKTITDVKTSGLLYRGFEKILENRPPLDAIYLTERICGICSAAHSIASAQALEDAFNITPSLNDIYIRDLIHGLEFIQNHIRHFYLFTVPSYVKIKNISPLEEETYKDFRIPGNLEDKITKHYVNSIEISRLAHEAQATLGGKAPHNHGVFVGGVTVNIDSYKLAKIQSIIIKLKEFTNIMLRDAFIISKYYKDYYKKGSSYENYMSFGCFDNYKDEEISYVKKSVMIGSKKYPLDPSKINENTLYAYYKDNKTESPDSLYKEDIDISKENAYSFIKAPRYDNLPMEVGPLARLKLKGEYKGGNSCMDRIIARVIETKLIIDILDNISKRIELVPNNQSKYDIPQQAYGKGLIDTTRGALAHYIKIENKKIKFYHLITPTGWNLSPKDSAGLYGPLEKSLLNLKLYDERNPVEIGRIARSFDPCVSCATHVISKCNIMNIKVV
ncbi:MAG: nickel-dependent hydrogenase large subunit [Clostridiaceae bacterium]